MSAVIVADKLRRVYGRRGDPQARAALDGIDLRVEAGEFVAVVGPSGSGKSTLLGILGALDSGFDGDLSLFGKPVRGLSDREMSHLRGEHIGFVFQAFHLLEATSVLDNVLVPSLFIARPKATSSAREALERVGLSDRAHDPVQQLSGGQRQRVAIARAIAHHPKLLLCDEPTGNLDVQTGAQITDIFRSLRDAGTAVVCATHEEALAAVADRRLFLHAGRWHEAPTGAEAP